MTTPSPLQRVALGLLVVFASATWPPDPSPSWARYDLLADPVGWALVLWGVLALARVEPRFAAARTAAVVAGLVSVPLWLPQLRHLLDASGEWAASLPQLAFCLLLARQVARAAQEHDERRVARRFALLVTGLTVLALLPVVVLGGGVEGLGPVTALLVLLVDVALVWSLFAVHRRPWLGGEGEAGASGRTTTAARPREEGDGRRTG
ncbi:hypothetical protein ASG49_08220 [Marmoricola sp. Leaf446]|uniref:hypothetical protein n=1 Tax=Marmoricola sp. Leaf446 TaxID=1736379 RepID=UPI0006FEF29D|nr:hypothetical protein [Marmoricola sp. Leaf446]KQT91969.1 hypothetical protein ASG49_08220 [Marmoricola sp. Leaf446]